ncbi:hypothetical protein [Salinarimonas ramus]|uniref:Uncharacterized protein n=1 Tax=Salinarimonas ramus TaxID=690164 RepID=A0A917QBQ0_9HYPH|nr:hypothetical protein [Salinarimonas ramus]GGK41754.1 hypothetical protein GCM10011322_31110 [Salinarimonas ramus]
MSDTTSTTEEPEGDEAPAAAVNPATSEETKRLRAEAQAARERDTQQAWIDHENEVRAVEERTARLRALRLAKEAEEAKAKAAEPAKPAKPVKRKIVRRG